jgi:hypothetical protein
MSQKGTQYTIRGVQPDVDQALRKEAQVQHMSLNAFLIQELQRIAEHASEPVRYHDLDFLIGSMPDGAEVDEVLAEFGKIDEELWR